MSSEVLILFIFRRVAHLGGGNPPFVRRLTTSDVSGPEILIIAIPATPGPVDNAYIVI